MRTKHTISTHQNLIEALEPRIAPASVFTYTDVDGDHVKITASKGNLTGRVTLVTTGGSQGYVSMMDLTDPSFQGANIIFTVSKSRTGDGFANVGFIDAHGVDLGKVIIRGDLGGIDAGDGNTAKPAIRVLQVRSMGIFGTNTPGGPGGGGGGGIAVTGILNTISSLLGTNDKSGVLGTVLNELNSILKTGVSDSGLSRVLSALQSDINSLTGLGPTAINSLSPAVTALLSDIGSNVSTLLDQYSSQLGALNSALAGQLGTVQTDVNSVVHGLAGPLGISGTATDALNAVNNTIAQVQGLLTNNLSTTVPSNLLTPLSAALTAAIGGGEGTLGNIATVVTDVVSLLANPTSVPLGTFLSDLSSLQNAVNTALGGSVAPPVQALLNNLNGAINPILALPQSLLTITNGALQSALTTLNNTQLPSGLPQPVVDLVNSVKGLLGPIGTSLSSVLSSGGTIPASALNSLSMLESEVSGLLGNASSLLPTGIVNSLTPLVNDVISILGTTLNPTGGGGSAATASNINGNIGSVTVSRDLANIFLNVAGNINALSVGGSLIGGSSANSGEVFTTGNINVASFGKGVIGGLNLDSGSVIANGTVKNFISGGSVVGGAGTSTGNLVMNSDSSRVSIHGDLAGNSGNLSAGISNTNGRIATVGITGSVMAGTNTETGSIRVQGNVNTLSVRGNIIGDATHVVDITAAATKAPTDTTDSAFGRIVVGGRVAFADILGGYDTNLRPVNGHAQIGTVVVRGDWIASNLVAGCETTQGTPQNFGLNTDTDINGTGPAGVIAKIASVVIGGTVSGTGSDSTDHFGFEAQQIGAFRFGRTVLHLNKGPANDGIILSQQTGGDVSLHEIGAALQ